MRTLAMSILFMSAGFNAATANDAVKTEALKGTAIIETQTCPNSFYSITLPSNGKLCQVFATELPASMIFFVPQSPSEVADFYRTNSDTFTTTKQVKQRYILQSIDKNTTLIISEDGEGSQVDVLVVGNEEA